MAFYDPIMLPMHVLLVDSDVDKLYEICRLLEFNSYRVTAAQDFSAASSMLSKQKTTFDLVMIDISSSNLDGYKLLHEAVNMGITAILMSTNVSATLVKCAIEDGAFLFMEKPTNVGELKYLWQHVLREKSRKSKENFRFFSSTVNQCPSVNKETSHKEARERLGSMNSSENDISDPFTRSKFCTAWTPELHEKFMASVRQLGEGRCFPKDILDLMNVPGLTRMQVASHLQKCRYGWRPSHARQSGKQKTSSSSNHSHRSKTKSYGLFPHLVESFQTKEQSPIQTTINTQNSNYTHNINMGRQGALNDNIIPNMNKIPNEVELGAAPNQGLQFDVPCDFLPNDDTFFAHNLDLQDLNYDHIISDGKITDGDDNQKDSEFWTSWIADSAKD